MNLPSAFISISLSQGETTQFVVINSSDSLSLAFLAYYYNFLCELLYLGWLNTHSKYSTASFQLIHKG